MSSAATQPSGGGAPAAKRPRLDAGAAPPSTPQADALLDAVEAALGGMYDRVLLRTGVDLPHAYANTQRDTTAGAGVMATTYLAIPGMQQPPEYGPVTLPRRSDSSGGTTVPMGAASAFGALPLGDRGAAPGVPPPPSAVATGGTNRWLECWKCLALVSDGRFVCDNYQAVSAKAWEAAAVGEPFTAPVPRHPHGGPGGGGRGGRGFSDPYESVWPAPDLKQRGGQQPSAPTAPCRKGWDWWGVRRDDPAVTALLARQAAAAAEARAKEEAAAAAAAALQQQQQAEQAQRAMAAAAGMGGGIFPGGGGGGGGPPPMLSMMAGGHSQRHPHAHHHPGQHMGSFPHQPMMHPMGQPMMAGPPHPGFGGHPMAGMGGGHPHMPPHMPPPGGPFFMPPGPMPPQQQQQPRPGSGGARGGRR